MQTIRTLKGYQLGNIHVDAKPYSRLPVQQARTLLFVATGLPQKTIAQHLGVKVGTVKKACSDIAFKFNTHTMRETVHCALQKGVLRYTLAVMLCLLSAINSDVERSFRVIRTIKTVRTTKCRRLETLQHDFLTA